jgi:phage tail-like protein
VTLELGKIRVRRQGIEDREFQPSTPTVSIGRNPENDLVLNDPQVSRKHAVLQIEADRATLIDLGSAMGTYIDNQRLQPNQPRPVPVGALIRIGPFILEHQRPATQPPDGPQPPQPEPSKQPDGSGNPAPKQQQATPLTAAEQPPRVLDRRQNYLPPKDPNSLLLHNLPIIFHDNEFLGRYLRIFEAIWEPLEWRQNHIHMYFNARTSPPEMLGWMESWFGLSLFDDIAPERRRVFLAHAAEIYRWRGTSYGLARVIEVCTGLTPQIHNEPSQPYVFRVILAKPANDHTNYETIVDRLIQAHKPAYAGYILEFR